MNWTALAEPDKTWDKCKEHFSKEYSDRRRHALVEAKGTGFGSAANAREAGHAREDAERLDEMAQVTCEILQQMNDKNDEKFERMMQQMASRTSFSQSCRMHKQDNKRRVIRHIKERHMKARRLSGKMENHIL